MLKIAGFIFLIAGSTGYGCCLIAYKRRQISEIRSFVYLFQLLKSAISYRKEILPDACRHASEKLEGHLSEMMLNIYMDMSRDMHQTFRDAWIRNGTRYFKLSDITKKQKDYLLKFPSYIGFSDEKMQITVIEDYIVQLDSQISEMDKRLEEQKKVIMGVSTISGMMTAILLL